MSFTDPAFLIRSFQTLLGLFGLKQAAGAMKKELDPLYPSFPVSISQFIGASEIGIVALLYLPQGEPYRLLNQWAISLIMGGAVNTHVVTGDGKAAVPGVILLSSLAAQWLLTKGDATMVGVGALAGVVGYVVSSLIISAPKNKSK
jgi:hypothetical protein